MAEPVFHLLRDAPTPVAPFSHAVEIDGWVFVDRTDAHRPRRRPTLA